MQRQRTTGWTLIEQCLVVAILATLGVLAAPALRDSLGRHRLGAAQLEFISWLQHARSTAAMRGSPVLVCPSSDGVNCNGQNQWDQQWLMLEDGSQPSARVLLARQAPPGVHIRNSGEHRGTLRFRLDGSTSSNVTTIFCQPGDTRHALVTVLSNTGRVRGAPADDSQASLCAAGS